MATAVGEIHNYDYSLFYRKSGISEIKNLLDGIKIPFIEISLMLLETCILF